MNKKFLEGLEKKLKGIANLRSIYLNCLIGRSSQRLDINDLNDKDIVKNYRKLNDINFSSNFFEELLSKPSLNLELTLSPEYLDIPKTTLELSLKEEEEIKKKQNKNDSIKQKYNKLKTRLNTIFSYQEDSLSEYGVGVFGFGYPILVKKRESDNKLITAPLIIWSLQIAINKSKKDTYIIRREEDSPIYLNQPLIASLEQENLKLDAISEEVLEDGIVDKEELKELIKGICQTLNLENNFSLQSEKIPEKKEIENLNKNKIIEGGVFGVYKQIKSNILKDIKILKENWAEFSIEGNSSLGIKNSYCSINTDPSQQKVINSLNREINTIIYGPPGTGKSQTLTGIITTALFNKKKILVVCEKRTALEILDKNLKKQELDRFSVIIENVKLDRKQTVQKVRDIIEASDDFYYPEQLEKLITYYETDVKKENLKRANVTRKVLDDKNWKEVVTKFLKYNKNEDKDKLEGLIKENLFEYSLAEYERLKELIKKAENQFFSNYNKWFEYLNRDYFLGNFTYSKQNDLKEQLQSIATQITSIEEKIQKEKEKTSQEIKVSFTKKLNKIKELNLLKQENDFDIYFDKNIYLHLSLFSQKIKRIKIFKKKFIEDYFNLKNSHLEDNLFSFDFLEEKKTPFKNFDLNISEYQNKLEHYLTLLETEDYFHKDFNQENTIIKEYQEKEKKDFNGLSSLLSKQIFNEKFINNLEFEKLRKKFSYYKEGFNSLKREFEKLVNDEQFEKLYNWKSFLYQEKKELDTKLLDILIEKFSKDKTQWLEIFSSYYFNNVLKRKEESLRPLLTGSESLKEIQQKQEKITKNIKEKIKYIWGDRWKDHDDNLKRIFNLRGSKGSKRNSLKKIFVDKFDLFTDFFPVLLLTPEVACTVLPLEKDLFDLVIFDEASQLRVEDTFSSYIRGKYKVISGDEKQMPPSSYFAKEVELDYEDEDDEEAIESANEESLLNFVLNISFIKKNEKHLDYHYRSEHPALIEFSNKAFYKSRLVSMPAKKDYPPFKFIEVNGLYQNRRNESEAKEVVKQIKQILENCKDKNIPSIGVATFNVDQRDLIKKIIREKLDTESLIKLDKSNYFVKNLENIQGDERDIIILSTTFGKSSEGKFKQNFGGISSKNNGYRLLNVLITRAKREVILLNSIPHEYYSRYQEHLEKMGSNNGRALLYAYIFYVKSIYENDKDGTSLVLKNIASNQPKNKLNNSSELTDSVFEEEVLEYLEDEIKRDRIELQYKVGGFRIDMVIKNKKGEPKIAVECDGATYHSGELAVQEDIYRQTIIEEKTNLIFYRIFSTKWWNNTRRESKKLIEFINKKCS